ncbi:MAG TPA: long-chain-fatty-acid--CoA ligase [Terriglobales bacterium]|jgi:fatty-acyl-CoA synthase|nr:long-chain-fatty-acid--CoA ligase [Terriglobales bacterium]
MNVPLTPLRFLRYAEQQFPNKTAVVCRNERFSYSQFADRASRLAGALRTLGIESGDRVAFLSINCHRLLEAYFGVLEAGAVLLPLNVRLAPSEIAFILRDASPRVLFFEKVFLPLVESFRREVPTQKFILMDDPPAASWALSQSYEELIASATPHRIDIMQVNEDALAELFYTSGTSANSKGVMLSHRNVYLHALNGCLTFDPTREHVHLHTIPLFHANGWGSAHGITFIGGKHVMIQRWDCGELFRLIEEERVTGLALVPTIAIALVNSPERSKYDLSSLERITIGGAASSPTLIKEVEEKLGCTCYAGYGLTETSPTLSVAFTKAGCDWQGEERYRGQAMTGYAIPGSELRVVDADGNDVAPDGHSVGEIIARGDGVMMGYWNQPEATAQVLRDGWLYTGDLATIDENGYLLIVDRKKDIIISGGENISSLEIEKTLLAHPDVYEVAVIPVPDEKWGETPKALVVLKPQVKTTAQELLEFCASRMARYKCPRSVEFLEALPKTGTGKILKRQLREKYWGQGTLRPELAIRSS